MIVNLVEIDSRTFNASFIECIVPVAGAPGYPETCRLYIGGREFTLNCSAKFAIKEWKRAIGRMHP